MPAADGLRRLGFTANEAKVYVALVEHPGITGYEVSRYSGVPRAKVYEVLEGLLERGAVLPEQAEDRTLYRALSYTVLLQEHRRSTDQVLTTLYRDLSQLTPERDKPSAVSVSGLARIMARVSDLVAEARESVLAAGRPEELQALGTKLSEAERRGVRVELLSRGPARVAVTGLHILTGRTPQTVFTVVVDGRVACLADLDVGEPYAAFLTAPGIAALVGSWIERDIAQTNAMRAPG